MRLEELHDEEFFGSLAPCLLAKKREKCHVVRIDLHIRTARGTEEGYGLHAEQWAEYSEIIQFLGANHVLDGTLFQGILGAFGRDGTLYNAPMVHSRYLLAFLGPDSYLSEVLRKELMQLLAVSDGDFFEDDGFG